MSRDLGRCGRCRRARLGREVRACTCVCVCVWVGVCTRGACVHVGVQYLRQALPSLGPGGKSVLGR